MEEPLAGNACTRNAPRFQIRARLDGATTMLMVGSNWTEQYVMSALEVKTGRWLGDSYVARKGSELEVRHRERGGMPLEKSGPARGGGAAAARALHGAGPSNALAGLCIDSRRAGTLFD